MHGLPAATGYQENRRKSRKNLHESLHCGIDMKHKAMSGGELCEGTAGGTGDTAGTVYDRERRDGSTDRSKIRRQQIHRAQGYYRAVIPSEFTVIYAGPCGADEK